MGVTLLRSIFGLCAVSSSSRVTDSYCSTKSYLRRRRTSASKQRLTEIKSVTSTPPPPSRGIRRRRKNKDENVVHNPYSKMEICEKACWIFWKKREISLGMEEVHLVGSLRWNAELKRQTLLSSSFYLVRRIKLLSPFYRNMNECGSRWDNLITLQTRLLYTCNHLDSWALVRVL